MARPVDVVKSNASVSDTKATSSSWSSRRVSIRSLSERPHRSSRGEFAKALLGLQRGTARLLCAFSDQSVPRPFIRFRRAGHPRQYRTAQPEHDQGIRPPATGFHPSPLPFSGVWTTADYCASQAAETLSWVIPSFLAMRTCVSLRACLSSRKGHLLGHQIGSPGLRPSFVGQDSAS